ncbi:hypothetical protein HZ326_18377 [Fusarium oxysporum f. sp. albedinis]|nr:hypothetical protein HZ326_18377 [Fusarium oxysporum f. sp. albedinis]
MMVLNNTPPSQDDQTSGHPMASHNHHYHAYRTRANIKNVLISEPSVTTRSRTQRSHRAYNHQVAEGPRFGNRGPGRTLGLARRACNLVSYSNHQIDSFLNSLLYSAICLETMINSDTVRRTALWNISWQAVSNSWRVLTYRC